MVRLTRPVALNGQDACHPQLPVGPIEVQLQPIVDVTTGRIVAVEALARFPAQRGVPVDVVFNGAYVCGYGPELEAACLQAALHLRATIPSDTLLTVNLSPDALQHPAVRRILPRDLSGVALEVTEQAARHANALVSRY
jgi:EAL domain-containing protein (putative c-di-GMP-specific phosphodiesterase class I)